MKPTASLKTNGAAVLLHPKEGKNSFASFASVQGFYAMFKPERDGGLINESSVFGERIRELPARVRLVWPVQRSAAFERHADQRQPGGFGQGVLFVIEGEERIGCHFNGNRDVEQIHAVHHHPEGVFGRQFARGADGPGPVELDVGQ